MYKQINFQKDDEDNMGDLLSKALKKLKINQLSQLQKDVMDIVLFKETSCVVNGPSTTGINLIHKILSYL